jgi:hypothetical protein
VDAGAEASGLCCRGVDSQLLALTSIVPGRLITMDTERRGVLEIASRHLAFAEEEIGWTNHAASLTV